MHVLRFFDNLKDQLLDPKSNKRIMGLSTYAILSGVSLFMTVMNIFTHKGMLTYSTAIFAVLCLFNFLCAYFGHEKGVKIASVVFAVELIALFTFFLISGNPDGFSAIWISMVPPIGMLFYGLAYGTVFCGFMLAELVFFLWLPVGNALLQYEYSSSFMMRFPILFVAFYFLAFLLEYLRFITQRELNAANKLYEEQARHDLLTGALNRQGIYAKLETRLMEEHATVGAVIFDIDFFKNINDVHGHLAGDGVLQDFAKLITENLNADVCRWGGEEFAAFFFDGAVKKSDVEKLLKIVENHVVTYEDAQIRFTTSAGYYECAFLGVFTIKDLIKNADLALYRAKETGRNRVVVYEDNQ